MNRRIIGVRRIQRRVRARTASRLPEGAGEALPGGGGDVQDGTVAVGGVADQDAAAFGDAGLNAVSAIVRAVAGLAPGGDLDAIGAAVAAVAALAPGGAGQAVHRSLATFAI